MLEVIKDMPAWPGRHLLEGGEHRRYFGLKTIMRGVVEFECKNQREYDIWTQGVSRLLTIAAEKNNRHRVWTLKCVCLFTLGRGGGGEILADGKVGTRILWPYEHNRYFKIWWGLDFWVPIVKRRKLKDKLLSKWGHFNHGGNMYWAFSFCFWMEK